MPDLEGVVETEFVRPVLLGAPVAHPKEIDLAFEVETAVELGQLGFRVRIYNDWQILIYEEHFDGFRDTLGPGVTVSAS